MVSLQHLKCAYVSKIDCTLNHLFFCVCSVLVVVLLTQFCPTELRIYNSAYMETYLFHQQLEMSSLYSHQTKIRKRTCDSLPIERGGDSGRGWGLSQQVNRDVPSELVCSTSFVP